VNAANQTAGNRLSLPQISWRLRKEVLRGDHEPRFTMFELLCWSFTIALIPLAMHVVLELIKAVGEIIHVKGRLPISRPPGDASWTQRGRLVDGGLARYPQVGLVRPYALTGGAMMATWSIARSPSRCSSAIEARNGSGPRSVTI
jgi:hypothetical protein